MSQYSETHRNCARSLYGQWNGLLDADWVERRRLADLEGRIRDHLFGIGQSVFDEESSPEDESDAFVALATGFVHGAPEDRKQVREQALNWLLEEGGKRMAARKALILFPLPDSSEAIHKAYMEKTEIRAHLIDIWSELGNPIPKGLLNQGELQVKDPELQLSIMRFLARHPDSDVSVFRHYYHPLVVSPAVDIEDPRVLEFAILGGMIRGDADALIALRRAMERNWEQAASDRFLRLCALSTDQTLFPVLKEAANQDRWYPIYLLALYGYPTAFDVLLDKMADPRTGEFAANAWFLITGQMVRKVPRMALVEEGPASPAQNQSENTMPDVEEAVAWLARRPAITTSSEQYLFGEKRTASMLVQSLRAWGGRISEDLADMLSIAQGEPVYRNQQVWQMRQEAVLTTLTERFSLDAAREDNPEPVISHA